MPVTNVYLTLNESMFTETSAGDALNPSAAYGTTSGNAAGAIEVLNFTFKIEQIVSADEDGRRGVVERIQRGEMEITKACDSRSPKLFILCCKAVMISDAKLKLFGPRSDKPYMEFKMQGVRIASYEPTGGAEFATEKIALRFDQMKVKYDNAGIGTSRNGNSRAGTVEYTWNWTMDVPGFSIMPPGLI